MSRILQSHTDSELISLSSQSQSVISFTTFQWKLQSLISSTWTESTKYEHRFNVSKLGLTYCILLWIYYGLWCYGIYGGKYVVFYKIYLL